MVEMLLGAWDVPGSKSPADGREVRREETIQRERRTKDVHRAKWYRDIT